MFDSCYNVTNLANESEGGQNDNYDKTVSDKYLLCFVHLLIWQYIINFWKDISDLSGMSFIMVVSLRPNKKEVDSIDWKKNNCKKHSR